MSLCLFSAGLRQVGMLGLLVASFGAAGCQPPSARVGGHTLAPREADPIDSSAQRAPLPLRIPILAVMMGAINRSSNTIFQTAASAKDLSEEDWLRLGEAAVGLVGEATLITVAGTGPNDAAWVAEPKWVEVANDMQTAGFDVGRAADRKDRAALTEATARLAQSCQSCHLVFSPHLVASSPALEAAPVGP